MQDLGPQPMLHLPVSPQVSELGSLTEKDLILSEVDTAFLPALHELAASVRGQEPNLAKTGSGRALNGASQAAKSGGIAKEEGKRESGSDMGKGEADAEALPSLSQLMASHGLLKLLPQVSPNAVSTTLQTARKQKEKKGCQGGQGVCKPQEKR
eukprot:scaffold187661_cov23-Tisochrysis_lutea.AAC.3